MEVKMKGKKSMWRHIQESNHRHLPVAHAYVCIPHTQIVESWQLKKRLCEYYLPLVVCILTLERKITHWVMDFSSAKRSLLKLNCERHWKLLKSLHSMQENFIYLTTTLNSLVRKSVKERLIRNGYIHTSKLLNPSK